MRLRFAAGVPARPALTAALLLCCACMPNAAFAETPQATTSSAAVAPVPPASDPLSGEAPASKTEPARWDSPADAPLPPPAPDGGSQGPTTPAVTAALPPGSGVLDSATVQRIVDRLLALHFLANAADAQDADALAQAIRDFQASIGISPSGMLDRDTVGRLTTT